MRIRARNISKRAAAGSSVLTIASMNPHVSLVTEDTPDIGDISAWMSRTNNIEFISNFPGRELTPYPNYLGTHGKMIGTSEKLTKFLRFPDKSAFKYTHNGSAFTIVMACQGKHGSSYSDGALSTMYNTSGTNGFLLSHAFRLTYRNNGQSAQLNPYNSHHGVQTVSFGVTAAQVLFMEIEGVRYETDISHFTFTDDDHDYGMAVGRTEGNSFYKVGDTHIFDRELTAVELTAAIMELKTKHNTP